jgi:hypothetical protein
LTCWSRHITSHHTTPQHTTYITPQDAKLLLSSGRKWLSLLQSYLNSARSGGTITLGSVKPEEDTAAMNAKQVSDSQFCYLFSFSHTWFALMPRTYSLRG